MLISTYTGDKEIRLQTVSLRRNADKPTTTYMFYCIFCGNSMVRVQGEVTKITPGLEPTQGVIVINLCTTCKREYNFQTTESKSKLTTITLTNYTEAVSAFHCNICRTPLIQHNAKGAVSLPLFSAMHLPFSLKCFRPTCPANFLIVDIVG